MVLATVELASEEFLALKQFPVKAAEMADVIICPQVINSIVRLEVHRDHLVYAALVEGGLIAVDIVCMLLVNHLHIFEQHRRMQYIIMIKKCDVLSLCKLKASVRIARYSFISLKLLIGDT